eukprot:SAG11_NODE_201_length_12551_cov_67.866126_2_plen_70_part_00
MGLSRNYYIYNYSGSAHFILCFYIECDIMGLSSNYYIILNLGLAPFLKALKKKTHIMLRTIENEQDTLW